MGKMIDKKEWERIKKHIQEEWDRLDDRDIEQINGDMDLFYSRLSELYPENRAAKNNQQVNEFLFKHQLNL